MMLDIFFADTLVDALVTPSRPQPEHGLDDRSSSSEAPVFQWEQYLEATEALTFGLNAGMDHQTILRQLGMTPSDYLDAARHWGTWFTQNAPRDPSLLAKHQELSSRFRAKYAATTNPPGTPA